MPRALPIGFALILALLGLSLATSLGPGTPAAGENPYPKAAIQTIKAAMRQSEVDTGSSIVRLRGVADAGEDWNRAVQNFRESLPTSYRLMMDVFVIDGTHELQSLCEKMFAAISHETVSFHESGSEIRPASYPALDRVAEYSQDCPEAVIVITGHSDASGNETSNRRLSEARASKVAGYLLERGANDAQLQVVGAGSAYPIADNATAIGREKNRRIEFSLPSAEAPTASQ
jgi:outer membrane protein OmpA-like peptidoglycan-associated protein